MKPTHFSDFENLIGKPRLQSYKQYFKTKNPVGMYMWNCEVSKCFGVLLSYFELSLRNRIHASMANHYVGNTGSNAHWWDLISSQLGTKTVGKVLEVRQKNGTLVTPAPNADEIVSRVSFGFWTSVLGQIDLGRANLIMPGIFPHHPLNANVLDWKISIKKRQALSFVKEMNDFRNRLAHHEPLWKFATVVLHADTPPTTIAASIDRQGSLGRFARLLTLYDAAMAAMSTSLAADLRHSSWRKALDFLLSERGISRYEQGKYLPGTLETSSYDFHKKFMLLSKKNEPVRIRRAARTGIFIPD